MNNEKNLRVDIWCNTKVNNDLHQERLSFSKEEFYNLIVNSLRITARYVRSLPENVRKEDLLKGIQKKYFLIGLDPKGNKVVYRSHETYDELVKEMRLQKERLSLWVDALAYDPADYDEDENFVDDLLLNDHFPNLEEFVN